MDSTDKFLECPNCLQPVTQDEHVCPYCKVSIKKLAPTKPRLNFFGKFMIAGFVIVTLAALFLLGSFVKEGLEAYRESASMTVPLAKVFFTCLGWYVGFKIMGLFEGFARLR